MKRMAGLFLILMALSFLANCGMTTTRKTAIPQLEATSEIFAHLDFKK